MLQQIQWHLSLIYSNKRKMLYSKGREWLMIWLHFQMINLKEMISRSHFRISSSILWLPNLEVKHRELLSQDRNLIWKTKIKALEYLRGIKPNKSFITKVIRKGYHRLMTLDHQQWCKMQRNLQCIRLPCLGWGKLTQIIFLARQWIIRKCSGGQRQRGKTHK